MAYPIQEMLAHLKTIIILKVFRTCDTQFRVWVAGAYCLLLSGVLLRKRDVRDQGGEKNGLQHCGMIYSNHRNIDKEFSKILF